MSQIEWKIIINVKEKKIEYKYIYYKTKNSTSIIKLQNYIKIKNVTIDCKQQ